MVDTNGWVYTRQPQSNRKYAYLPKELTANGKRSRTFEEVLPK
jgi:hypothetical protein